MRLTGLLLAAVLLLAGCGRKDVEGSVLNYWRYDRQTDSFAVMVVYANIDASPAGLNHIRSLWPRRDRFILDPDPIVIWPSARVLERETATRGAWIYLNSDVKPDPITSTVDLGAIEIRPGDFFTNEYGTPCYFHRISFPGSLADQWLARNTADLAEEVEKTASSLSDPPERGKRKPNWEEFRSRVIEAAVNDTHQEDKEIDMSLLPLDETSLERLGRAAKDSLLQVKRDRARITMTLPLSERDAAEVQTTLEQLAAALKEKLAKGENDAVRNKLDLLKGFPFEIVAPGSVRLGVDIEQMAALRLRDNLRMPVPKTDRSGYATTVAGLEKRGIPVDKTDRFRNLLIEFGADPSVVPAK